MESRNIRYVAGIDHLRAFAALLIVLYHGTQIGDWLARSQRGLPAATWPVASTPLTALLFEGHTAVSLFMVLTGFIFTYGAYGKVIDYRPFIRNRFLRTYPLFLVLLALGLSAFPQAISLERLLFTLFGFANFPDNALQLGPFSGMFWAISLEWQFYLIFPFLFRFLAEARYRTFAAAFALLLAARWLAYAAGANPRDISYWTIAGRLDQFLFGMLAGFAYHRVDHGRARRAFPPAVALILVAMFLFNQAGGWPAMTSMKVCWPAIEGAAWSLFTLSYVLISHRVPQGVSRVLCHIGTISYSIYLWHFPFLDIAFRNEWRVRLSGDLQVDAFLNTLFILLPVLLAFSALSFALIERPFLGLRGQYLRPGAEPTRSE